jgi:hypothetical protein
VIDPIIPQERYINVTFDVTPLTVLSIRILTEKGAFYYRLKIIVQCGRMQMWLYHWVTKKKKIYPADGKQVNI